jgi:hypothetical protein
VDDGLAGGLSHCTLRCMHKHNGGCVHARVSVCVRVDREREPGALSIGEGERERGGEYRADGWGHSAVRSCCALLLLLSSSPTYGKRGKEDGRDAAAAAAGRGQRLLREAQHHNKLSRAERARHASPPSILKSTARDD